MMLLNLGIVPTENHSKITPICRSHADCYVVIVVKNFNPKSVVLNGFNKKKVDVSCEGNINLKTLLTKKNNLFMK